MSIEATEVERIAGLLKSEQKKAILSMPLRPRGHGFSPATLRSLREGGVLGIGVKVADYDQRSAHKYWHLNDLGLAVRSHLMKGQDRE